MVATNELRKLKCNKRAILEPLTIALAPFAPHISEELWSKMGNEGSVVVAEFPAFDESVYDWQVFVEQSINEMLPRVKPIKLPSPSI